MAEQQELRVILRTIAEGQGAQTTANALRQVQQQASATNATSAQMGAGFAASATSVLRFTAALTGLTLGLSAAASAGQAIQSTLANAIQAQAQAERTARATAAAYGQSADQFVRFAVALEQTSGFARDSILEAALSARTLSANYGLTIEQTQRLIRVSADLARIRGIGVAESFERVQSAIRGEAEASEFLGLTLNDTFLKNNAMNGSLRRTFETMTDAQKAQVRYTEVLRQSSQFAGLASTSTNSLDAAFAKAAASGRQLELTLGQIAKPATVGVLNQMAAAANALNAGLKPDPAAERFWRIFFDATRSLGSGIPAAGGRVVAQEQRERAVRESERQARRLRELNEGVPSGLTTPTPAELQKMINQNRATEARRAAEQRRLAEVNELPRQTANESLAELAFLDQRDAAVRDVLQFQREGLAIQTEMNRLRGEEANATLGVLAERQELVRIEREIANQVDRGLQLRLEARRIAAEQRAAPSQNALQDTERTIERARLVAADLSQAPADRSAAIREAINLQLRVAPRQRLEAFDAETGVLNVDREQRANDLATRARQNPLQQRQAVLQEGLRGREDAIFSIQQAMDRQETLANVAAARTDEANVRLGQIIQQGIADGFAKQKQPMQLTVQVLDSGGNVTYEEILEAEDQASFPPVVQVSGVRRRP